ncbi:hypothetical protein PUV54_10115 [Hyphococcus flavus]|uniref:Localization factor PodJL n=1 Tax=Hyphococcus flavus TaxID=1866326 RepID=A0AAF0CG48_9PROT|nr:hypothetical protein [Hyphococcus flavus]WDI30312.1 hypothetical protein PUV54_10115 [Hyphococcus flavus]
MKSNAPWSVKGIERDAREAAKEAARREGMTVGEWLNQMIYSHGQEGASSSGEIEGLKLRDIVTAIEHLRNRIVEAEKKNVDSLSHLSRNVGGVVERVQRLERVKPQEGTYQDLDERLGKIEKAGGDRNRIDALKALEKAVSQVAVQFSSAQKTTLHRLDSAEAQLQEFAERIDRVGEGDNAADVNSLRTAIEGLAERVARAEKVASEAAALKDAAATSADPEFVEQTGARLRVLGDEIKRGEDQIRAFEKTISKLADQIEAAEKRSSDGVQKVAETIAEVREQITAEVSDKDSPDVEALVASARQETEAKLEGLQRSFDEMKKRMEALRDSAASSTSPAPADQATAKQDAIETVADSADASSPAQTDLEEAGAGDQNEIDELEDAVAALEADTEAEEDPFAFDDDIETETEDDASAEAGDDFTFQLDDDAEEDAGSEPVQAAGEETQVGDARSRLAKVRNALTGDGFSEEHEEEPSSEDEDDELSALLSDLDEVSPEQFDDEDDEDVQDPGTASLAPASNVEFDDSEDDEDGEDVSEVQSEAGAEYAGDHGEESAVETDDEEQDDYAASARRRAEEAASQDDSGEKRLTRRNLTAKQRAILAARARQKRLTAESEHVEDDDEAPKQEHQSLSQDQSSENEVDETNASPASRFAKITSALSAARSRLGRNKSNDDDINAETTNAVPQDEDEPRRNGDRAALETLKATSSARPVTFALIGAIVLAFAALAYLMKDVIFPANPDATATTSAPATTDETQVNVEEPGASQQAAAEDSNLPVVPEAPAIDPEALYLEAMASLEAAENEEAAIAAVGQLQDAAALGFPPAQLQLGELYKTGQGVEQDLGQARVWFRRAANGGNVLAMHRIGVMTARGDGGPADSQEAIAWFEQAANFGLVDSQYNLGAIYHPTENGGSVQNAESAFYWYSLAAQNGDSAAEPLAAGVGAGLTSSEREAVNERLSAWTAQTPDPTANIMSQ